MTEAPEPSGQRAALTREFWQAFLARELATDVSVVFTRARRTPISVRALRRPVRRFEVRLHEMFSAAPDTVPLAVAHWIRSGRRARLACRELDSWIQTGLDALPKPRLAPEDLVTRGEHHDLEDMRRMLLRTEFESEFAEPDVRPLATWGRRGSRRTRYSLRLGSYDADFGIARIHPVLDQAAVPDWFVRYVVFHELLHAALPPTQGKGSRWIHHSAAFRRRERAYADYARAIEWEDRHIDGLIRSARRGVPLPVQRTVSVTLARAENSRPQPDAGQKPSIAARLQGWLFPD